LFSNPFSIPFSPMHTLHLDHTNYTWQLNISTQNNIIKFIPKWLILQKRLKTDFTQKPNFFPKWFLSQNQVIKTENHIILIHSNNFLNSFNIIKIKLFHYQPIFTRVAKSPQFNHNNTFINTQNINWWEHNHTTASTSYNHDLTIIQQPQHHFSSNWTKSTKYTYIHILSM